MGEAVPPAQTRRPLSHMATSRRATGSRQTSTEPVAGDTSCKGDRCPPSIALAWFCSEANHETAWRRAIAYTSGRPARARRSGPWPQSKRHRLSLPSVGATRQSTRTGRSASPPDKRGVPDMLFRLEIERPGMADWKFPASNRQWSRVPRLAGAAQPLSHRNAPPIKSWSRLDPPPPWSCPLTKTKTLM